MNSFILNLNTNQSQKDNNLDKFNNENNNDDDLVITGISCRFPQANNINEFWKALENKKVLSDFPAAIIHKMPDVSVYYGV
jgi:transketolase N-terminal domain/subunit